jgi:hypothetical protein
MYYFGYGSNMLTSRLQARVPSAEPVTTASLQDWALCFHKRSRDGSGKCNILPDDDSRVIGVVFDVSGAELHALDEAEQRGRGYERRSLLLHNGTEPLEAFAYIAQPAYVDDALLPYDWYHALVLAGARQHGLPPSYVSEIETVPSYPDPNRERRRAHQSLLQQAGFSLLPQ